MSKFAGFVIGAIEIGIGIATGNVALIIQGGITIAAQAIVDLTAPKTPAREASEMTIKLGEQPRVMQVGETYTPGSLVDGFDYGGKYGTDWEVLIIRLADHKCSSLTGFYVNDIYVPYTGDGNYPQFDTHHFQLYFRADTSVDPLPAIVLDHGPGWTAADIGQSGCDVIVAYLADSPNAKKPAWPGGRPHFGFVLKGKLCYDLRKDDTVTGGSGAHRWDDSSTWEWSNNAIVCWDNFERGVYANDDVSDQTKLLVGRGLTEDERPPVGDIIAAANLCDEDTTGPQPFERHTTTLTLFDAAFSADGTRMLLRNLTGDYEYWYVPSRTMLASGTAPVTSLGQPGIASDGTIWSVALGGSIDHWNFDGRLIESFAPGFLGPRDIRIFQDSTGTDVIFITGVLSAAAHYVFEGSVVDVVVPFTVNSNFTDGENVWVAGNSGTTIGFYCVLGPRAGDSQTLTSPTGSTSSMVACNPGGGNFVCAQAGSWYLIDDTAWTTSTPVVIGVSLPVGEFERALPGDTTVWVGWSEISFTGPALLRTVNPFDWGTGSIDRPVFDRINDAIIADNAGDPLMWRFLDRSARYIISGPIYANQPFLDVEQMFAAATAGSIVTREGAVLIEPGQAKSIVATITDDDLLSGSKVSWNQGFLSESSDEWLNSVVATYVEPDQKWNSHAAPIVRDTADIVADGEPREAGLSLRLVRYQPQALHIAEIARRLGRIWGRGSVTLGPRFCELEDGDWIQWQSNRYFSGGTKTFRIEAYSIDEKWQNTLTLREISGDAFAVDDATFLADLSQPQTPRLPPPEIGTPDAGNWTLAAITLDSPGASIPALEITGSASDDAYAEAIIFEYWLDDGITDPTTDPDAIPWTIYTRGPPSTTAVDITSVTGGATYYAAVTYVVSGITGDRLVLGPVTVADYTNPTYQEEDGVTPLLLEDDSTVLTLETT